MQKKDAQSLCQHRRKDGENTKTILELSFDATDSPAQISLNGFFPRYLTWPDVSCHDVYRFHCQLAPLPPLNAWSPAGEIITPRPFPASSLSWANRRTENDEVKYYGTGTAWVLELPFDGKKFDEFFDWIGFVSPEVWEKMGKVNSLVRAQRLLILRHFLDCNQSALLVGSQMIRKCHMFYDHIFAKDRNGKSLGPVLTGTGKIEAQKLILNHLSIVLGSRQEENQGAFIWHSYRG